MTDKIFPKSNLPIRKTVNFLPEIFRTETNEKFLGAVLDPLIQPGVLEKLTGYIGRRYGKTFNGKDVYLDDDDTLRSRYQLEPAVVIKNGNTQNFYDYIDFKNQLKFFSNDIETDDKIVDQEHYTWNPPICWDKFVNFRDYYWEPLGPPPAEVLGNFVGTTSTYKVSLGFGSTYILSPDNVTNNPRIKLYRGQTYKFNVNVPGHGFNIRSNIDVGKSNLDSLLSYNKGVTNNGIEQGEIIFEVPFDAPDILYYQSSLDIDRFGQFIIGNIESNTELDIENEILGKETYTSSNGIVFTNGLIVNFGGLVIPSVYANDTWLVEGVGRSISLTRFKDLIPPDVSFDIPDVLFDNEGFDTQPFDDAINFPAKKDYIVIAKDSKDRNPWSRYNRWFHKSVLEYSYSLKGRSFESNESLRAKRPIIEFSADLQLFNHGSILKESVDFIDSFTTDIFSIIEGSAGYIIENESLFDGARVLFTADTDRLVNNKIYIVRFINHVGRKQIHLEEESSGQPTVGDGIFVKRGKLTSDGGNRGLMFHFTGSNWVKSQEKTTVNQPPKFDVFDSNEVSFSDINFYPGSSFNGTHLISYKIGNSTIDTELGFSLSYLNIDNVGDIEFVWNWDIDNFSYLDNNETLLKLIATGFYKFNNSNLYQNGWIPLDNTFIQPIIDSQIATEDTNELVFKTIDWNLLDESSIVQFYVDGEQLTPLSKYFPYVRENNTFKFSNKFKKDSSISLKIITNNIPPDSGYYQIPIGLEKNPLNSDLRFFTYGQAFDHLRTSLEFNNEIYKDAESVNSIVNLRDISGYQNKSTRFLKHSGLFPLSTFLLCDKQFNIVKSLQYAKKSYSNFKNDFIIKSSNILFNDNVTDLVDEIIKSLTSTKTIDSPFFGSDMIGSGAYSSIDYVVDDVEIKTFSLSARFNLTDPSDVAVYVYHNGKQLLHGYDYEFNSTFGFISVNIDLTENDFLQIREYVSTSVNFIPPTPTKLGLWKKYKPRKFIDDTFIEPTEVIQGHDGSLTVSFGDYRDDLLLELEYRIYNNIKQEYKESVFDFDNEIGTYYHSGDYNKSQIDKITSKEFLRWISNTNIGYTLNEYFDSENSFTYTYSNMTDVDETVNLPGWWRGVYRWFYRTDRPHTCPWEMLGFSEMPEWWEDEYGPAPYTKGNLILWEDIRDGIIRQGTRAGTYNQYKHDSILSHIPVDNNGKLLSPLDSNLAYNFSLINNQGSFVIGDLSPVENSWRNNSEWPFALIISMCLLKPVKFINLCFDRNKNIKNKLGQLVNKETDKFITASDLDILSTSSSSGLVNYMVDYVKSLGISLAELDNKLVSLEVLLSSRLSGFVDKLQQKYLLDTKSPKSTSSTIFIPPENYDVFFNVSVPIKSISYSGVIIEKTNRGWSIQGYDSTEPYFNYFEAVPNQQDPIISVGGVSASFSKWETNKTYSNGEIVEFNNFFFRSLRTHQSGNEFDTRLWTKLPKLPVVGAVTAAYRRNFNKLVLKELSYGEELFSIQAVVDFLLGYSEYLESQGVVFGEYDPELKESKNWITSAKEFMFWTRHNWNQRSLISLSPAAEKIKILNAVGVADSMLDSFYDYQILKSDGKPLLPQFLNVKRDFQSTELSTIATNDGFYLVKLYYVLKEHVVIFDDRTVFNDVIYDKTSGYRQERIKTQGFRTVDWDGDYTSPGFLFDNVNIKVWQPFVDYRLGDIVSYKSFNWVSQINHKSLENFEESKWSKLDSTPEKQLVPNFDYRINLFEDYFETGSDGIGQVQRDLARHSVGYQPRTYLQNLAEDSVTQFELYQGFIRDKGTVSALEKVFSKKSAAKNINLELNEEWAFRVGQLGGYDQTREFELSLDKSNFLLNPQPVISVNLRQDFPEDRFYRVTGQNFTIENKQLNLFDVSYKSEPILTAGYVRPDQVDLVVGSRQELFDQDIDLINENQHIWITFDLVDWNVYRYNRSPVLLVAGVIKEESEITVFFNRTHNFKVDDLIGLRIENLKGFYEISGVGKDFVVLTIDSDDVPEFDESTLTPVWILTPVRIQSYSNLSTEQAALLPNRSKLWVDHNQQNFWEVVDKKNQYIFKNSTDFGTVTPEGAGTKVLFDDINKLTISSIPSAGIVNTYLERQESIAIKQILTLPTFLRNSTNNSFGQEMAISPDSRWLIIGSPRGFAPSKFKGDIEQLLNDNPDASFLAGDIVLYKGKLWKATTDIAAGDGSTTIDVYNDSWELTNIIAAEPTGSSPGFSEQGFISIFEFESQQWNYKKSYISQRPAEEELFGSKIKIGKNGNDYYLFVTAPNALSGVGRTYIFSYNEEDKEWYALENDNYRGEYDNNSSAFYPKGSIVYNNGQLFESIEDTFGDGSSLSVDSNSWIKIDNVSSQGYLPKSPAVELDGSTLYKGKTGSDNQIEVVKEGDVYGSSLAISNNASILVVGAPFADDQFFENYKGIWKHNKEYFDGDVVRFSNFYHQLVTDDDLPVVGIEPIGLPWINVGDSSKLPSGKVFVYHRDNNNYILTQTISAETIQFLDNRNKKLNISVGDEFGYAVDLDFQGDTLIVSSPKADLNLKNQGSVYVFKKEFIGDLQYKLVQVIESYDQYPNEYFGLDICISKSSQKIVVGSKNSPYQGSIIFDQGSTIFDNNTTRFIEESGFAGGVYVFEKKSNIYFLTEKIDANLSPFESFGHSVYCTDSVIVVGSPDYIAPAPHGPLGFVTYEGDRTGITRLFKKAIGVSSWDIISKQEPVVDISKVAGISLYDTVNNIKLLDLDVVDPAKYKILGIADQELKFKTEYDPAIYSIGDFDSVVDPDLAWSEKHVGELWWNISKSKWLYYEQGDTKFRSNNWSKLAQGSSVVVCEWVETPLLPSEWAEIADTTEGLSFGISGQPLHPNDNVYTRKVILNETTFEPTETLYYYWVVNKTIKPNTPTRRISAADVSALISDPAALGVPFIGLTNANEFLLFNADGLINTDEVLINFLLKENNSPITLTHNEFEILSENDQLSVPSEKLENKWLDSLVGFNEIGQQVPDQSLSEKQKHGILYRPRQSMFIDRIKVLKDTILRINQILKKEQFADTIDLTNLNSKEEIPNIDLNLYDISIDQIEDIENVGVSRISQAILKANIVNGSIDTIDIIDPGYGYKVPPPITISGTGFGAIASCTIDNQGRVNSVLVSAKGKRYTIANALARKFSVLVGFDKTQQNKWSIYSYDNQRREFVRTRTQLFDTTKFWNYIDWWKDGYSAGSSVDKEIQFYSEEEVVNLNNGSLVRIKEYGNGGWAVIEISRNNSDIDKFIIVGRQAGTIELSNLLYKPDLSGVGYDRGATFDTNLYDLEISRELRIILKSLKEDILLNEYRLEWNRLFFLAIRYVFQEQPYVDWAFKTSLIKVRYDVGPLEKKLNYKNDNLESYLEYLHEVKPYRTTIRDFYNVYSNNEVAGNLFSDFDLPPVYSLQDGKTIPITEQNSQINEFPWNMWKENNSYEVVDIRIVDSGNDYTSLPEVKIVGTGQGATARAFISNKQVVKIILTDPGTGYLNAPEVLLVGGNSTSDKVAKAIAIIGNTKTRTFDLTLKFDRFSKNKQIENYTREETFTASGLSSVFELKYPPLYDQTKIKVFKNDELVLRGEYNVDFYNEFNGNYTLLKAKLIFKDVPKGLTVDAPADTIQVLYEINEDIYNSIDRIEKSYNPMPGMKNRSINQLMTGIDFGGVKIQGSTFDVTGGWDALPWYSDTWDSVEPSSDFYIVVDGSTVDVTLPFVPTDGQLLNVYIKPAGQTKEIRIDDPLYNESLTDPSINLNPNIKMPTFVGDGSTNVVPIRQYIDVNDGDILIFRTTDSDGSIKIVDSNIIDTNLFGGNLSAELTGSEISKNTISGAYTTAIGTSAEDISIDGGLFITPLQVPAPEENIPGQILDSVSIKVFDAQISGAAPLMSMIKVGDGITSSYELKLKIVEASSVIVYVNKLKQEVDVDYSIDFLTNRINFVTAPEVDSTIELYTFGIGGISIIDYQEFTADGDTDLFLTSANFSDTAAVVVTVNGVIQEISFSNSTDFIDVKNKTIIQFGTKPERFSVIKIISLSSVIDIDSLGFNIVRVNQQDIVYTGSREILLDSFVSLSRGSELSSVVVEVNNKAVRGVDTIVESYTGSNNIFEIGKDPLEPAGIILPSNIKVFVNDRLLTFLRDYDYDGVSKIVTIFSNLLTIGDIIKIENNLNCEYSFSGNSLILDDELILVVGDKITVTWFSEYPSMGIVSDEYVGNKVNYNLKTVPLDAAYVWVYKNGIRLVQDVDYRVEIPRGVVYLSEQTTINDLIKIVQFGSRIFQLPSAYEIHKDVLNVYRYKRMSLGEYKLSKNLNYYDKEIYLTSTDDLFEPDINKNIPGVVSINNEKIAYFKKDGNILTQLRRGYFGSSIKETHLINSIVINQGSTESIPYNESQIKDVFVSDGENVLIGPLSYTPVKTNKTNWYKETIPDEFGPCYEIEVFAAGKRLFKDPITVYDETLGQESPAADKTVEAEFSVNGQDSFIRLTSPIPAGYRITVVKRIGNVWYDNRENLTLPGKPLKENKNPIAKFIAEKNTDLPE